MRKWKLADVSRVVVDGVEVDIKRVANEFVRDDGQPVQLELEFREEQTAQRKANARRSNGAPLTFHVHALDTHRAAEIADKWLAKPLSQALIGSFLDQVRALYTLQAIVPPTPAGRMYAIPSLGRCAYDARAVSAFTIPACSPCLAARLAAR